MDSSKFVANFLCEKLASKKGVTLPEKYWQIKEWKSFYQLQIIWANRYFKLYSKEAVIAAIKDKAFWFCTLTKPEVVPILCKYQDMINNKKEVKTNATFEQKTQKKNIREML